VIAPRLETRSFLLAVAHCGAHSRFRESNPFMPNNRTLEPLARRNIVHQSFALEAIGRPTLRGEIRRPASADQDGTSSLARFETYPAVVLIGGWLKFKEWGFYPYLARALAERGYATISFNPSHAGLSDGGGGEVADSVLASTHTPTSILEDLNWIRSSIANGSLGDGVIDEQRLALVGHSMGASFAILHAAMSSHSAGAHGGGSAAHGGCFAVVGLSSMATLHRFDPADERAFDELGYLELANGTAPVRRIYRRWLDDLKQHAEEFSVAKAIGRLTMPVLLVHGEENLGVGIAEAEVLYHHAPKAATRFVLIEKTGHSFGAAHPFRETTTDLERVLSIVGNFLDQSRPR
jgi:pimeloyl-ACP methyl ester carboxylesterase